MEQDMLQEARRAAERFELGRADALEQFSSMEELRTLRSQYVAQGLRSACSGLVRQGVRVIRSLARPAWWQLPMQTIRSHRQPGA
jgi:hypothetical protein